MAGESAEVLVRQRKRARDTRILPFNDGQAIRANRDVGDPAWAYSHLDAFDPHAFLFQGISDAPAP